MPNINYANPGVYIVEKESGARPIEVAGTSTAAFLGITATGDANIPIPIESNKGYEEQFGGISENGMEPGDAMAFSVRAFFLNGGRNAYVVNVCRGGEKSKATLCAGRDNNAVPLFKVKAKGIGERGDDIEVILKPEEGPGSGYFTMNVKVKEKIEKEYKLYPIAPGLPGSLEQVVNADSKLIELTAYPALEDLVFPSATIDFQKDAIKSLAEGPHSFAIKNSELEPPRIPIDLAHLDPEDRDGAMEAFQKEIKSKLVDTPYERTPLSCKIVKIGDVTKLKCILKTDELKTNIQLFKGEEPLSSESKNRSELFTQLICGSETSIPLKQAVLSGEFTQLYPTWFRNKPLSVRIGNEFGRTMVFDPGLGEHVTLQDLAEKIAWQIKKADLPIPRGALPTAAKVDGGGEGKTYCQVMFGPDAPKEAMLETTTEGVCTKIKDEPPIWEIKLTDSIPDSITFTLKSNDKGESKAITVAKSEIIDNETQKPDLNKFILEFNNKINELAKSEQSTPRPKIQVEVIENRLLICDPENDVSILTADDPDVTKWLNLTETCGAATKPLNDIQATLPMIGALKGGENGIEGEHGDYTNALEGLEKITDVSIICLPGNPWDKGATPSKRSWQIVEEAIAHAARQKDRMVIVDPPGDASWRTADKVKLANLPTSSYSAVYYPWLEVPVSSNQSVKVPPCGFAAGIWSRTDMERGVWKAPAGVDARIYGAQSLADDLTDIQGGALNLQGVNCLRNLSGYGQVIWGGRTRATLTKPQWRYLPVRRTALMIEDSLRDALLWAVHQPNNHVLWSTLKLNIEAFMGRLFRAGAFQPQAPKDAYFVKCGLGPTMTQDDIDAGVVRVEVGFAPVKPAEFVVITIEQINENR